MFKYYRLVRKWACKTYDINDGDLELLIYLDCIKHFTRDDFKKGSYTYAWDRNRWLKLRKDGWIDVWRNRNQTTIKYNVYKTSFKCQHLIMRIYKFYKNKTYTDKVYNKAIDDMIKDKDR
jgi:hypothetical protein